jgi:hypothetical protein
MRQLALRFLSVGLTFALFSGPVSAATTLQTQSTMAPADEYFGHYHISILAMQNTLKDFSTKIASDPEHAAATLGGIAATEDAMRDWSTRYPNDPMVPKLFLRLERLYLSVGGSDATEHAQDTLTWFDTLMPTSPYTRMAHTVFEHHDVSGADVAVSDDGTPVTENTPEMLGVVPGLLPDTNVAAIMDTRTASVGPEERPAPHIPSYAHF